MIFFQPEPVALAQTKNIVPSERDKPAGLHMSDFLPVSGAAIEWFSYEWEVVTVWFVPCGDCTMQ